MAGMTLIELMLGLVIFGVLLALGLPAFGDWMRDLRIRGQADRVLNVLQLARSEALRRNRFIRFQLVTTLDENCVITNSSNLWVMGRGDPTNACDLEPIQDDNAGDNNIYSNTPVMYRRGLQETQGTAFTTVLQLATPAGVAIPPPAGELGHPVCFTPNGHLTRYNTASNQCTASANPGLTTQAAVRIDFRATDATCAADVPAGPARCLRITIASNGDARLCDPAAVAPDVRVCPW